MQENTWNSFSMTTTVETLAKQDKLWQIITSDDPSILSVFDENNLVRWYKIIGPRGVGRVIRYKHKWMLFPSKMVITRFEENSELAFQLCPCSKNV
jgi:hypothetical protein